MTTNNEYLLFIPNGNVWPLQEKFRELGGFYNGLGYAFPSKNETFLQEIVASLSNAKIHKLPLGLGQSFEAFQQSHKAAFFQGRLIELDGKLLVIKDQCQLEDISEDSVTAAPISDTKKQTILELIQERDKLKHSLEWAVGMEKVLLTNKHRSLNLKSISEISKDYFVNKPHEKPRLLYFVDATAKKISYLHKGIVGQLIAEGGRGKTHLLALLGACVATGLPWLQEFMIETPGAVALIVGENDADDIHRLMWKTREHLAKLVTQHTAAHDEHKPFMTHFKNPLEHLDKNLFPYSVHGIDAGFVDGKGTRTDFYNHLLDELKQKEPPEGWQLIILDPASRFAGPEAEKDNAIATAFIASLENISENLRGKPTIILSHHKSKAAQQNSNSTQSNSANQSDARGASGLTDGCRWQANLTKDKNDPRTVSIFEITKTNFTSFPRPFKIRKDDEGVPFFVEWIEDTNNEKGATPKKPVKDKKEHNPLYAEDD